MLLLFIVLFISQLAHKNLIMSSGVYLGTGPIGPGGRGEF